MTAQPAEQPDQPDQWSGYEATLALLSVAAIAETGRVVDRLTGGLLVEELPSKARALLVAALARSWAAYRARAASLAAVSAAGWLAGLRGDVVEPVLPPPPAADLARLTAAAETVLDAAAEMQVAAADADPRTIPEQGTLEEDMAAVRERQAQEAVRALAGLRADLDRLHREQDAADVAERASIDAELAQVEALRSEEEAAERDALRAMTRADAEAAAAEARQREAQFDQVDRDAAAAEKRAEEARNRRDARRERQRAQGARLQRVARSEVAAGAAETLSDALAPAAEVVGWTRKVNNGACERCVGWWNSGGIVRGPTPVRPYSVRMKRHPGCSCLQRPVTQEEADVRGTTNEPEPRLRNKRAGRPPDRPDGAGGNAG